MSTSTKSPPEASFRPSSRWVNLARTLQIAQATYGDVVALRSEEGEVAYLLAHPEHVRHVLVTAQVNYRKTASYNRGRAVLGHSLLVRDDAEGVEHRRLLKQSLCPEALAGVVRVLIDYLGREIIDYWAPKIGTQVNLHREMDTLFRRLMSIAVFGDADLMHDARLATALGRVFDDLAEELESPFVRPRLRNDDLHDSLLVLDEWLQLRVRAARASGPDCFLSRLVGSDSHLATKAEVLRDEAVTLLFAGYSTTAIAAASCVKYLHDQPEDARAVLAEIADFFEDDLETAVLLKLPVTTAFIQEVLRLRPPAWLITRRSLDDDVVGGFRVPGETHVLLAAYVTHRHPEFWAEPDRFVLHRFISMKPEPYAYFPFGAGFHNCIGNGFAMVLLRLVIAMLCTRFVFIPTVRSSQSGSYVLERRAGQVAP